MRIIKETVLSDLLRSLSRDQCRTLLSSFTSALTAFSKQNAASADGPIFQPLRTSITTAEGNVSLFMPSSDTNTTGIKVVTVPKQGDIRGVINIFSPDGGLTGLLSAAEITAFRTALATMALLVRCETISKSHIAVFGAGKQAEWHARLAALLFPGKIETITLINRSAGRLNALCDALTRDFETTAPSIKIERLSHENVTDEQYSESIKAVIGRVHVIACCTPSTEALFPYTYLSTAPPSSRFISLIGSYKPNMQEIDTETLLSGGLKVYVDSRDACRHESGEIIRAKLNGEQLIELGECFADNEENITAAIGQNIIFKCVGMGIMDLVVARTLVDIAAEMQVGSVIEDF